MDQAVLLALMVPIYTYLFCARTQVLVPVIDMTSNLWSLNLWKQGNKFLHIHDNFLQSWSGSNMQPVMTLYTQNLFEASGYERFWTV